MDQEIGTLDRLNLLFTRYPAIDEVGIVPLTEAGTSCVVNDCKLALLKNELRMIYISGRKVMLANNQTKLATADACRALVLINPNNYTAWNNRKKLVTSGDVHVNEDLRLVDLVLGLHPKSAVSWAHRLWLLQKFKSVDTQALLHEVQMCERACDQHQRNYYAWSHRLHVLRLAIRLEIYSHLTVEEDRASTWVKQHISDYSGMHYLQLCILSVCAMHLNLLGDQSLDRESSWDFSWRSFENLLQLSDVRMEKSTYLRNIQHVQTRENEAWLLSQRYPEQPALLKHHSSLFSIRQRMEMLALKIIND